MLRDEGQDFGSGFQVFLNSHKGHEAMILHSCGVQVELRGRLKVQPFRFWARGCTVLGNLQRLRRSG